MTTPCYRCGAPLLDDNEGDPNRDDPLNCQPCGEQLTRAEAELLADTVPGKLAAFHHTIVTTFTGPEADRLLARLDEIRASFNRQRDEGLARWLKGPGSQ